MIQEPTKIFPCDCYSEGLVVTSEFLADEDNVVVVSRDGKLEDEANYYGISISFWGFGPYSDGKLPLWNRIKCAWSVLKTGHPWLDMVMLKPEVAKSFAYRILYMLEQIESKLAGKKDELKNIQIVDDILIEKFGGIVLPDSSPSNDPSYSTTAFPLKESQDGSSGDAQQGSIS